jgi:hypothetical protein
MKEEIIGLCARMRDELKQIAKIRDYALRRWEKALTDEDYLGSVAFDLHCFYQGVGLMNHIF